MKKPPTKAQRQARFKKAMLPTIGVGEDAIRGRGDGGRLPELGCGDLGENIAQSERDASAIARIDGDQQIRGGGDDFDGEFPADGIG